MSEANIETTPETVIEPTTTEPLSPLQIAHNEVLAKRKKDKELIATLEAKVAENESAIKDLTVNGPVKGMMESLSRAPESLWAELSKTHKVEMVNGTLTLLTLDGKPTGIPFEREPLLKMLLASENEATKKLYNATLIVSRASGANYQPRTDSAPKRPTFEFGFR